MIAIAKNVIRLPVAHIQHIIGDLGAVRVGIGKNWKPVKGPTDDRIGTFILHLVDHASRCYVIVVIVTASCVAATDVKLPGGDRVELGMINRQIGLRQLAAGSVIVYWHAVHRDTQGRITCMGHGSKNWRQRDRRSIIHRWHRHLFVRPYNPRHRLMVGIGVP